MPRKARPLKETLKRIDISTWNLDATEGVIDVDQTMREFLAAGVNEALMVALEADVLLSLPFFWGDAADEEDGGPVSDPLMLRVRLPLQASDAEPAPLWETSLGEFLRAEIDDIPEMLDPDRGIAVLEAWRKEFAALITKIDAALEIINRDAESRAFAETSR